MALQDMIGWKILFFVVLMVSSGMTVAGQQLQLTLNVSPRPNPYLSEWETRRERAILTVTNPSSSPVEARLRARVLIDGKVVAETRDGNMPALSINPGVSNFFADEILPGDAVKFYGKVEKTAQRTGMLPAGIYQLCVELTDLTGMVISQPVCRSFTVTAYQLPALLQPAAETKLPMGARPTFRWTPVIPSPQGVVTYRVLLFEVLQGQYPMQAFRANQPIMDIEVPISAQLIWPAEIPLPTEPMQYIWTVQALDESRRPVGEREGFSEPAVFEVGG